MTSYRPLGPMLSRSASIGSDRIVEPNDPPAIAGVSLLDVAAVAAWRAAPP